MGRGVMVLAVVVACAAAPVGAVEDAGGAAVPAGHLELVLADGVRQWPWKAVGAQSPRDLTVLARGTGAGWEDVWGHALGFNKGQHRGVLRTLAAEAGRLRLELAMEVRGDAWITGATLRYTVELQRVDGRLTGRWEGVYSKGPQGPQQVSGSVRGRLIVPERGASATAQPAPWRQGPPRMLLRPTELPRLRERMTTPLGRVLCERMRNSEHPVCLGLMYQLTGEADYAHRAVAGVRAKMTERAGGWAAIGRVWGYRAEYVACAYDLCREAWDPAFRAEVGRYLDWIAHKCIRRPWTLSNAVNLMPGSNYMVVIWAGAGMAALARMDQPGPRPEPPAPSGLEVRRVAPLADYTPAAEVAVSAFADGRLPLTWSMLGSWPAATCEPEQPLAAMGGLQAACRAFAPGLRATCAGQERRAHRLARDAYYQWQDGDPPRAAAIDLSACFVPPGGEKTDSFFRIGWFHTVIRCERERLVRFAAGPREEEFLGAAVSGVPVADGDFLRLEPGLHPLLIGYRSTELYATPWGKMLVTPRLEAVEVAEAERVLAARSIAHEVRAELHREDLAYWEASGGLDPDRRRLALEAAHWNALNVQGSMGDGGFQAEGEGYTLECHRPLLGYAAIHRALFGHDLTGRPDAGWFAPRYVHTTVFTGGTHKGRPAYRNQTYGGGGGTIPADYLGRCVPLCPEPWVPALKWFWLQRSGVEPAALAEEPGISRLFRGWANDLDLVYAFLHFPVETPAASPEGILPKWWAADGKGFYAFRNRWSDGDDIVAQIYAKAGSGAGWNAAEAGTFQIQGLGHAWAAKAVHDRGGGRMFENVVTLPDDPIHAGARCAVAWRDGDPDTGSGAVTIDMDALYQVAEDPAAKKKRYVDAGWRGWRAFAVDYSGRCGAPALFAVADRIDGGGRKVWTMHIPDFAAATVSVDGRRFTIERDGVSLVGTVLAPAETQITVGEDAGREGAVGPGRGNRKGKKKWTFRGIRITGADPTAGEFLVVMSLQRGAAPAVQVQGSGLEATATVGAVRVGLDERRLRVTPIGR